MLSLGDATVVLDGNAGEGALALDLRAARPALQGTLAFDTLDLSAYADGIAAAIDLARAAPGQPLDWPRLDQIDVDLRLSANALKVGTRRFGRTAASAALRDSRLDVAVGDMQLYGGRLSANFSARMSDGSPDGTLQARIDQVDIGDTLTDLAHVSRLDGKADITLNLSTRGETWNGLVGSLAGAASVKVTNGKITGIDLDSARRRHDGKWNDPDRPDERANPVFGRQRRFRAQVKPDRHHSRQDRGLGLPYAAHRRGSAGQIGAERPWRTGPRSANRQGPQPDAAAVLDHRTLAGTGDHPDFEALSRRSSITAPHESAIRRFARELFDPIR